MQQLNTVQPKPITIILCMLAEARLDPLEIIDCPMKPLHRMWNVKSFILARSPFIAQSTYTNESHTATAAIIDRSEFHCISTSESNETLAILLNCYNGVSNELFLRHEDAELRVLKVSHWVIKDTFFCAI